MYLKELENFDNLSFGEKKYYLNSLIETLYEEDWDTRAETNKINKTLQLIIEDECLREKQESALNETKVFWTSFKVWLQEELPSLNFLKPCFVRYDNWNGGTYFLDIDWTKQFQLLLGIDYDNRFEQETISVEDLKLLIELLYSDFIDFEKRYNFTIEINNRLAKFKLPYRLTGGKLIKSGLKTTEDNKKIINWLMFEAKIKLADDKILSKELLDKHTALNYLSDALEYLLSLINKKGKTIEQLAALTVCNDENSKLYAVIKSEVNVFHAIINEYFDIRHNEYLNKAKENREPLSDKLFIEYLYNRIYALLFIVKNNYLSKNKNLEPTETENKLQEDHNNLPF
ncbi:MAG: hypothetical protein WCR27_06430 [Eubacteriales bacterium]